VLRENARLIGQATSPFKPLLSMPMRKGTNNERPINTYIVGLAYLSWGLVEMRILGGKRKYMLFLVVALFLGLQLLSIGVVQATEADATPHIDSIDPTFGIEGETVTLTGTNFGSPGETSKVTFGFLELTGSSVTIWSDTEIVFDIQDLMAGEGLINVSVTTANGESNWVYFILGWWSWGEIASISPNQALQNCVFLPLIVFFENYSSMSTVQLFLTNGSNVIMNIGYVLDEGPNIFIVLLLNGSPGVYDVVAYDLLNREIASLPGGFTIVSNPYCGAGSGSGVLMLGMTMGLLSLAGSGGFLARRRRRKKREA
jgi:hypothetical protein